MRRSLLIGFASSLMALASLASQAQTCPSNYASVTASELGATSPLAAGILTAQATGSNNQPLNFSVPTVGAELMRIRRVPVVNGTIVGGFCLPRSDRASLYVRYHFIVRDTSAAGNNAVVLDAPGVPIAADTFSLDTYEFPGNAAPQQVYTASVAGTTVGASSAANQLLLTSATGVAVWTPVVDCANDGAHGLTYSATSHSFTCTTLAAGQPGLVTTTVTQTQGVINPGATQNAVGPFATFNTSPSNLAGPISGFKVDITQYPAGGQVGLSVYTLNGTANSDGSGNYTEVSRVMVPIKQVGVNSYVAGVDFVAPQVAVGQFVGGYFPQGVGVHFSTDGAYPHFTYIFNAALGQTQSYSSGGATEYISLSFDILKTVTQQVQQVTAEQVQAQINAAAAALTTPVQVQTSITASLSTFQPSPRNRTSLLAQTFAGTSLPPSWTTSGDGWTVNDALISPTSGTAYSTAAYLQTFYAVDARTERVSFKLLSSNTIFGYGHRPGAGGGTNDVGTLFVVDAAAGNLTISNSYKGDGSAPTAGATVAIPFALLTNRSYLLTIAQDHAQLTATLRDSFTGASVSVTGGDNTQPAGLNQNVDFATAVWIAGQYSISRLDILANIRRPRVAIGGDSVSYGFLATQATSWAGFLKAALPPGEVVLSGRIGGLATNLLARMTSESALIKPDIQFLGSGTNDASFGVSPAAYLATMQAAVNQAKTNGSKVVVMILPPTPNYAPQSTVNAYNVGLLGLTGVDGFFRADLALSLNHDGVTQDSSLFVDGVHPNATGGATLFARLQVDIPWIFD